MHIDHIFIFTDDNGKVADDLVAFGLTEGNNRVHRGQGTTNRKFYFDNFFLEILWVHDETEINSEQTRPSGLWQRASFKTNPFSPFGLCLVNADDTDALFEKAFRYQPDYFPKGMGIDIIRNDHQPDLPWTFRLPFKGQHKNDNEPTRHENEISVLTQAIFEYQASTGTTFLEHFSNEATIRLMESARNWLTLVFDNGRQGQTQEFEQLSLTIEF